MIMRWLKTVLNLIVYFCAATLLAQVVILTYLWSTWQLDRERVLQMLAIAQGIDLFAARDRHEGSQEEIAPEQLSYQGWIDQRSTMFRDLELREQALSNAVAHLRFQQQQQREEQQAHRQRVADFEARLLALEQRAESEGRETVGRILEAIKPKQAKEQLVEMLDNDETGEVVTILNDMMDSKRAKIIAEFKTPEENAKISEVLRLIREGEPVASLIQTTIGKLPDTTQSTSRQ
jgi:flagellar motility protein MotE (MotC chaperone)